MSKETLRPVNRSITVEDPYVLEAFMALNDSERLFFTLSETTTEEEHLIEPDTKDAVVLLGGIHITSLHTGLGGPASALKRCARQVPFVLRSS